jgi:hypothetical protein
MLTSRLLITTCIRSTTRQGSDRQISEDGYPTYLDAENDPYTNSDLQDIPREDRMTAVMYVQPDGTALYAVSPKPPTPEAVARAQFVDKTYVWKGAAPKAQLP